jgi:signal transduction histidine kinase/DNA-binding response OmpR family regulator
MTDLSPPEIQAPPSAPERVGTRPCVLLVDDQPARLLTYEAILEGVGVDCVRALSGREALERLLRQQFAVILLDVCMPDMDGFETARMIREHPRFERTPIIFVTGVHLSELDTLKGYEVGALDYIQVPVVPEILRSKIALLVELYGRRSQLEALNKALADAHQIPGAARSREARSSALVRLGDLFRSITEPSDLAFAAAQLLGETLGVSRCGYGTIDTVAETISIERDWNAPGVESIAGVLRFREYGTYIDELKRGETVVCSNVELDSRTAPYADRLKALQAWSFVNMPVIEQEGAVALLYLNHALPRSWPEEELSFIRDIAERTRIAVERRRHEQAVALDLKRTRLLRDLAARLVGEDDISTLLGEILDAAIDIANADCGTIQLLEKSTDTLVFVATRGIDPTLATHFASVSAESSTSCGLALASGKRVFVDFDTEGPDPDGSLRLHFQHGLRSAQSTPLMTRAGRPLGMFSTHWRSHRRLDEGVLRFLDLLARQAADLLERAQDARALRLQEQQLREADRRKDEFIAILAHELRNPLVPIRTGIELLKRATSNPQIIDTIRPMMERQMGHVIRLINDLLDVSRVTSGKIEIKPELIALAAVVDSAVEAHREALTAKALNLEIDLSEPDREVHVDPTRFAQVIGNLLHNATKFTPVGGMIGISACVEAGDDDVSSVLRLSVSDSGVGIAPDILPRIFELFAYSDKAGRTPHGGLGIGLGLARRIVELHRGTIEARSDGLGCGSQFIVRIPTLPMREEPLPDPADDSTLPSDLRILVVEDNPDAASAMKLFLGIAGAQVTIEHSGHEGLIRAHQVQPHIVLLDIGMPDMDGYTTCRELRKAHGSHLTIIALTGWGQEKDRQKALGAGFDSHLTKPVEPEQLLKTIRRTLQTRAP